MSNHITEDHARGMLQGILAQRRREGLADPGPYALLDPAVPGDRKIIQSLYASMARDAMGGQS